MIRPYQAAWGLVLGQAGEAKPFVTDLPDSSTDRRHADCHRQQDADRQRVLVDKFLVLSRSQCSIQLIDQFCPV